MINISRVTGGAAALRKIGVTTAVAATLALQAAHAQTTSPTNPLVGTWTLASLVNKDAQGNQVQPWGSKPVGAFMFSQDGHFLETIINEEKANASLDYFGTYTVENGNVLKLHVINCSEPRFRGKDIQRSITLSENQLSYGNTNPSVGGSAVLTWQRVK